MNSSNRINLQDPADVLLWADTLSIPVEQLHDIVARVGPMAPAVRYYAMKVAQQQRPARQKAMAGADTPLSELPSMRT